jgi:hypothetical protein
VRGLAKHRGVAHVPRPVWHHVVDVSPGSTRARTATMIEIQTRHGQHDQLTASLGRLWGALVDRGVRSTLSSVDRFSDKLEQVARRGGVLPAIAGGGLAALLAGRNPIWGVVKGAIAGTSPTTIALVVVGIVLALVLGPVFLILLLLGLVGVAVVVAVRSGAR